MIEIPDFVFIIIGVLISALGTLVGVGGGFLLVPLLFYLSPGMSPTEVTAISLFCISLNAISGSVQYSLRKLVHFRSALFFGLASLPGVWLGVRLTEIVRKESFELIYAALLTFLGIYLLVRKGQSAENRTFVVPSRGALIKGSVLNVGVGVLASFFGIGGGIIHVPFLHRVLNFPVHYATATSQFILAITSVSAVSQHLYRGTLPLHKSFVLYIAAGMVMGAQIGGYSARHINPKMILRVLSVLILCMAARIFLLHQY